LHCFADALCVHTRGVRPNDVICEYLLRKLARTVERLPSHGWHAIGGNDPNHK
jgi:hypothetical protein